MARASYDLIVNKTANFKSLNGTEYTCQIWWNSTSGGQDFNIGSDGVQITYETDGQYGKNSPILASKCTIPIIIENLTDEIWLDAVREDFEERQVWLTIKENSQASADIPYLWCGYFILDLSSKEDVAFPYEASLTAVDGLASLKDTPFVRETNSSTGVAVEFPYIKSDTYANAGHQRIINDGNSWIKILMDNVGQLLASDTQAVATNTLNNYLIQTSVNWFHEDMPTTGTDWLDSDPLKWIQLNMANLYQQNSDGYYSVPSCYQVLELLCRQFNMRVVYWNHTFHFTQIDLYNLTEQGTAPFTAPVNIPTREYYYTGSARLERNYVGNKTTTLYQMVLENITSPSEGLLKLSGGIYDGTPAISQVESLYMERAGENLYNGFPLFPSSWGTSTSPVQFTEKPLDASGAEKSILIEDADELAGFLIRIPLAFTNTASQDMEIETCWTIRAKPASSAWGDADNKTMRKFTAAGGNQYIIWSNYEYPLTNNQEYILQYSDLAGTNSGGGGNDVVYIFDSSTDSITDFTSNLVPTHADFIGLWEFQFFTFSEYDSNATYPMRAITETADYSHGRITSIQGAGTNYDGTTSETEHVPTSYAVDYTDAVDPTQNPPYVGMFVPIADASSTDEGVFAIKTINSANNMNSFIYNVGRLVWGDGSGANTKSTIKVWNGSAWIYVNPFGKWNKATLTWNSTSSEYEWSIVTYDKKIVELLNEEILNNQSSSLLKYNGTTALSVNEKFFTGSTKLKYMNPIAKLTDTDSKKYIMTRSTFNMNRDEWNGEFYQIKYEVPSAASSVTTQVSQTDVSSGNGFNSNSSNGTGAGMWNP